MNATRPNTNEERDGKRLDTEFRTRAPLSGRREQVGRIEWKGNGETKQFEVGIHRLDTPKPLLRSLGIHDIAAANVGDAEQVSQARVSEEIQEGDFKQAQVDAQRAIEKSRQEYQDTYDVFHKAVSELLTQFPQSLFQLDGSGFNPNAMDGFLNTGDVGHKLAAAMETGSAYLIAPDVKDNLFAFLHRYQESFARVSGGMGETYSGTPSHPWSPGEQQIIPSDLGFTLFLKIPNLDGQTEVHRIYFLYGDTVQENEMLQMDAPAANIDQEVDKEGIEQMDKAA